MIRPAGYLRTRPPRHGRRGVAVVGRLVSFGLLMVLVFAALVLIIVPKATGSQTYTVLTNSMAPKHPPGTFLVVKPAAFSELKYGDIVTFQLESGKPAVETHRIVGFVANALGNTDRGLWVTAGAAALIGYGALLILRTLRGRLRKPGDEDGAPEGTGDEAA